MQQWLVTTWQHDVQVLDTCYEELRKGLTSKTITYQQAIHLLENRTNKLVMERQTQWNATQKQEYETLLWKKKQQLKNNLEIINTSLDEATIDYSLNQKMEEEALQEMQQIQKDLEKVKEQHQFTQTYNELLQSYEILVTNYSTLQQENQQLRTKLQQSELIVKQFLEKTKQMEEAFYTLCETIAKRKQLYYNTLTLKSPSS